MNFVKRAGLYTRRHKLKSSILFLVLMIISTFILTSIAIENAVNDTTVDMRINVGGRITLDLDMSEENFELNSIENDVIPTFGETSSIEMWHYVGGYITNETLEAVLAVSGVIDYNMTTSIAFFASGRNFNFLPADFDFDVGFTPYGSTVNMHSTITSERFDGFVNGNLRLESGRHLTADDYRAILISDELAEYNNINLGDTMEFYVYWMGTTMPSRTLEFEVIGIYSGTRGIGGLMQTDIPSNQGIVDMATTIEEFERISYFGYADPNMLPVTLNFYIEDPINIQSVFDEIVNLPEVYGRTFTLTMGIDRFEVISDPLESLQGLVYTLIVIISVVSMAILTILLTIWTHGRVKEIGIFLSNGIKKLEIVSQFILEISLIAVVAFAFSFPISQVIADEVGQFIITQFTDIRDLSLEQTEPSYEDGVMVDDSMFDGLSGMPTFENTTNQIEVLVNRNDLIWVYVIGLPVVIVSVLLASHSTIKLKPREILTKMS